jgi:hypothetical protein
MTKNIPVVSRAILSDPHDATPSIQLDTPAWFAWLAAPTTTCFSYALFNPAQGYIDGFMTVRKAQRQRGGAFWSVYRRRGRHLRKIYVGPSTALTQTHLEQIASRLQHPSQPTPLLRP